MKHWKNICTILLSLGMMSPLILLAQDVDLTSLTVGDGSVSTQPEVGFVWSCQTAFQQGASGAQVQGPWFNGDGTFDATTKVIVDGQNIWDSELSIMVEGDERLIMGNGLPSSLTGNYPTASSDDAYQYDRNPHSIEEQEIVYRLPANPTLADESSCLDMGAIGIMITGTVFFNALDAGGRDAAAWETLDGCAGHPERTGEYHHHDLSDCVLDAVGDTGEGHSPLVGYALDGFGLYGQRGEDGQIIINETLDACHGHTHVVEWDGDMVEIYHYHATYEYPYTLGCYRGTPIQTSSSIGQGGQIGGSPPQGGQGQRPPQGGGNGNPPPPRPGG